MADIVTDYGVRSEFCIHLISFGINEFLATP